MRAASVCDAKPRIDDGLHQRGAVDPGSVDHHARLTRSTPGRAVNTRCTLLTQPPQVMPVTDKTISFMLSPKEISGSRFYVS
jgi:hypothetical protein